MEFVQGDDLKQILDGGRSFTLEQSAHLMRDLLAALDYAHRQNIVHRDVKPANLLVEANGRVKLTDFGVARIQDSGEATRTRGSMVGTLKYMSPEQVQGLTVDARADIFAAGVVLYQLLTGRRPFDGDSDFAIIQQIVGGAPAAPSSINAQLPPELDAVVDKALAKSRDDRFASAHAFLVALQEAVGLAPDPTILPPAGQRLAGEFAGTGSGALRSSFGRSGVGTYPPGSESSGSTVTQELELVYWKDVKESDDPVDLQGFLERFPQGIYADLARRRLKRLLALSRGENTGTALQTRVLDGSGSYGYTGFPPTVPMGEETLVVEDPSDIRAAALGRDEGSSGIGTTAVSRVAAGVPSGTASVAADSSAESGAVAGSIPAAAAAQAPPSVSGESPAKAAPVPQASAASAASGRRRQAPNRLFRRARTRPARKRRAVQDQARLWHRLRLRLGRPVRWLRRAEMAWCWSSQGRCFWLWGWRSGRSGPRRRPGLARPRRPWSLAPNRRPCQPPMRRPRRWSARLPRRHRPSTPRCRLRHKRPRLRL